MDWPRFDDVVNFDWLRFYDAYCKWIGRVLTMSLILLGFVLTMTLMLTGFVFYDEP